MNSTLPTFHVSDIQEYNSIRRLAEDVYHLKTYDTALPMEWYDDVFKTLGVWPQSYGFVWCYNDGQNNNLTWGEPYPLTEEANLILNIYSHVTGKGYRFVRDV